MITADANGRLAIDTPDIQEQQIDYVDRLTSFTTTNGAVGIGDDIPGFIVEVPADPILFRPFVLRLFVPNVWNANANILTQCFLSETTPGAPSPGNWNAFGRGASVNDSAPLLVEKRLDSSAILRTFKATVKSGTAGVVATLSCNEFAAPTPMFLEAVYL